MVSKSIKFTICSMTTSDKILKSFWQPTQTSLFLLIMNIKTILSFLVMLRKSISHQSQATSSPYRPILKSTCPRSGFPGKDHPGAPEISSIRFDSFDFRSFHVGCFMPFQVMSFHDMWIDFNSVHFNSCHCFAIYSFPRFCFVSFQFISFISSTKRSLCHTAFHIDLKLPASTTGAPNSLPLSSNSPSPSTSQKRTEVPS